MGPILFAWTEAMSEQSFTGVVAQSFARTLGYSRRGN